MGGKSQENAPSMQKKDKAERTMGVGRKTREKIVVEWNPMTALRFQTLGRHKTSPASLQERTGWFPFNGVTKSGRVRRGWITWLGVCLLSSDRGIHWESFGYHFGSFWAHSDLFGYNLALFR